MKNIHRVLKDSQNPYFKVSKGYVNDPNLSFKAKGILTYLLSKPDAWQTIIEDVVKHGSDGHSSVSSGLDELRKAGYIKKIGVRNEKGHFTHWETKIYEDTRLNQSGEAQ